ncbi:MAG TPA: TauD/TfdA family dioxygenase [Steroidobacteraceae bacterium]|jgi:alpha-ketoglutarate-dependent taurine dioxygenase|nr:TauD/TfdA family dioxygenase [Steroidobacteraceae bacterium]
MPDPAALRRLGVTPETLTIEWGDGRVSEFASLWLRDNRSEDRDAHSGQRLVDVADLPERPRLRSAVRHNGKLHIEWQGEANVGTFELAWLAACDAGAALQPERAVRLWLEGARLSAADFAAASPQELRAAPSARLAWLTRLLQDGLAFLHDVPATPAAILEVMPLVGRVLDTNYGLTFDVRSVPQPQNLAYSDLGLGLHTDNPYREPVPGFQALHVLVASNEGGDSLFADGFALAEHLRRSAPDDFARLTTTAVPFHYRSPDADLYAERPLIQLSARGAVSAVHYNNRSVAPLGIGAHEALPFYDAYRRFARLLREARFQLRARLGGGTLVVFDNQRTLHGRSAFSSARQPRHLRGCYLSRDSVYSETALLRRTLAAGGA